MTEGVFLVQATIKSLYEIRTEVDPTTEFNDAAWAQNTQQTQALENLSNTMARIDSSARATAAMGEELTAMSNRRAHSAWQLAQGMGSFETKKSRQCKRLREEQPKPNHPSAHEMDGPKAWALYHYTANICYARDLSLPANLVRPAHPIQSDATFYLTRRPR